MGNDYIGYGFILLTIAGAIWLIGKKKASSLVQAYSSTMGVLGTFVGVYVGLMDFDETNIAASVPELLGGLKTAFSTSIVGMIVALLAKLFYRPKEVQVVDIGVEKQDNIISVLNGILFEIKSMSSKVDGQIESVEKNIKEKSDAVKSGFNILDQSLKEEIDAVKTGFNILDQSLIKFGEEVAKQSSEKLIESIQRVMDDFDTKINSQLGQSFNDLRKSVEELNKWQNDHVDELKQLNEHAKVACDSTKVSVERFAVLNSELEKFRSNEELLKNTLQETAIMIQRVARLGIDCEKVIPTIDKRLGDTISKLDDLALRIKEITSNATNALIQGNKSMEKQVNILDENVQEIHRNMQQAIKQFSEGILGVVKKMKEDIDKNSVWKR